MPVMILGGAILLIIFTIVGIIVSIKKNVLDIFMGAYVTVGGFIGRAIISSAMSKQDLYTPKGQRAIQELESYNSYANIAIVIGVILIIFGIVRIIKKKK